MAATGHPLLEPALGWSSYLRLHAQAQPALADWLAQAGTEPITPARIRGWLAELAGVPDADTAALPVDVCRTALRRLRQRVFLLAMVRDMGAQASLEEVTGAMTTLADLAVGCAYRSVAAELALAHGVPQEAANGLPQEMLIMGMGKLGGGELNVSSDIDLVMLYGDEGETTGRRPLSHHEFYGRLTRRMMPVLADIDEHGYVFRTDLRLRPDGDAAPLAWSLDAFESYLVSQGREWERYAWLKARHIEADAFPGSASRGQIEQLESLRRPFVFRKYFDFDALAALRGLRERIRDDWNRRAVSRAGDDASQADNVKLGEGGIREIEFIVQLSQLIRGGRMPALQTRGLLASLHAERDAGLIDSASATQLESAYRFLRRLEHMLQYRDDQQTHILPTQPELREALARAMGFADRASFEAQLAAHRTFVEATFRDVFRMTGLPDANNGTAETTAPPADPDCSAMEAAIRAWFPDDTAGARARVSALCDAPRIRALPEPSRQRLDALLPEAIKAAAGTRAPQVALGRLCDLFEQIAQRRVYLSLLTEYPQALARVARMVAASEWAAQYLTRHPLLLDSLIDWRALMAPPDFAQIREQLVTSLDACVMPDGSPDVERQMNLLRDTRHQVSFHILAQDLEGHATVEKVGDYLSLLADLLLEQTLARVWPQAARGDERPPRFAVIAYGKLGGKELGYESDLDLVFLFDDTNGDDSERYVRFGRRIVSWLGSMTSSGRLYEVDLRLRPDGDAGLVAAALSAFERYQRTQAWVWEHQAITRARFAVGDPGVGERFEEIRREVLLLPREPEALAAEVRAMRERISAGHPNPTGLFDLKHDAGGMVDVEFVTQYLVLRHAQAHPALLDNLGNIALLRIAGEAGLIPTEIALQAGNAYRRLRREQHALRLQGVDKARVEPALMVAERTAVQALWTEVLGARLAKTAD
ncbi:bifunctional [glutamate--ammonia ligase]-adenylyl-L-tyrosine phosphorylase/[glutamate--ammonia-ligase] adenylyltransferase [Achromobacter sp. GG226]|uniref:bifunctional [glutamate--ammonia ligase]-adenylyl-L-tyrosine phosphorylase/[glutamate--ammonia-ligase] adenylyltransferase n=1 Tax=Verticiella alkaliphila TaxID=2779529 RepID=UPI001C0E22AA|nr:bifunctional [glutamate--ammonia ligase]-adenylyl-L-tyrosine phosphorylase/[glutamate--ammonia-ligase] adenylyltransferase [Verticiella sp. GG226]MBU4611256.1 bifunctional [glutamate--ammonia ligase]-adenylyl-L-tyrosine phosphorylase/[glutamate--ammonia-ligase] adenylyltransferase [Verticiella sp. GG226]